MLKQSDIEVSSWRTGTHFKVRVLHIPTGQRVWKEGEGYFKQREDALKEMEEVLSADTALPSADKSV